MPMTIPDRFDPLERNRPVIRRLTLLLPLLGLLAIPSAASAKTNVAVGVGDQSPRMFDDANWQALKLKKTRYFIEWNAAQHPAEIAGADAFVSAASAHGVKVLMHISTENINASPRSPLPSVSAYKSNVGQLIKRYRARGVTDWGAWNEANHKSQPTSNNPKRAAQFYTTMKSLCKGCKIVALDVLDQAGVEKYIASWMKAAGSAGRTAKVIGIHNYSEVNRKLGAKRKPTESFKKYPGTDRIIKAVRKKNTVAKFWLTETGGLASFAGFSCSLSRQSSTTKFMFGLIKKYDKNIERLYSYNWFGAGCSTGFDAGLVDDRGVARPALAVFRSGLKNTTR
jgi:hypothetical protein